MVTPGGVVIMR